MGTLKLADKDTSILINIYSGLKSFDDNLPDCEKPEPRFAILPQPPHLSAIKIDAL